jgi:PKD repeat protein
MTQSLRVFSLFILLALFMIPTLAVGQNYTGTSTPTTSPSLEKVLNTWEVYQLDINALNNYLKNSQNTSAVIDLQLGFHHWKLDLIPNRIISENYKLQVLTENGLVVSYPTAVKAFKGHDQVNGGMVRMTIDEDFLSGYVYQGDKMYYIEPLKMYDPNASSDLFVVYERSDVNRDQDATCGADEVADELEKIVQKVEADQAEGVADAMACYALELAIASDKLMFTKYGSVSAVENHNIAVINDVEGDYTGNFNHDLDIVIVTQFVVTGTDPWTSSTAAGTLLASFRTWGNAGNFGVSFDLGELWTNRDFDGGTVGIAYLNAVCNTLKYHCLQDFTGNSELLRCMTSHEIGHNFSLVHDPNGGGSCPPNYIMCPFVSNSSVWSDNSVSQFNSYMTGLINSGCVTLCGPPPPPLVADFTWSPDPACPGQAVTMDNNSTGNITGYSWKFQNGTPGTSTQTNPTVTWLTPGTYNITLTVSGAGGPVSTVKQITVSPLPVANFTFSVNQTTVTFTSTSTNATVYSWDFGDGEFSLDQNPVHTYATGGFYVVVLTVTNDCGTSTKTLNVNTAPTANFSANPTAGCATLTVQYTNESSPNAVNYQWLFPGGSPSSSTSANPVVNYNSSGVFNVTLTASNNLGSNTITKTAYIQVQNIPTASFTSSTINNTVSFTSTAQNATSYSWNFGDGGTSTLQNPTHTYLSGGTYTVVFTTSNICGNNTTTQTVTIVSTAPPVAAFTSSSTNGCAPLTVQFTNTSTGAPTAYAWTFPGGSPANSTAASPSVVFGTAGTYTVTMTATNANGSSTATATITVGAGPTAGFSSSTSGTTASFTNTSVNAVSYAWSYSDGGSSTMQNPTHTFAGDGTYSVTLTATNPCGTSTSVQSVVIVTPPTAAFSATPSSGCAPLTVQFNNSSSANSSSYTWDLPGATPSSSTLANPTVVYSAAGVYTVTLTVGNAAGTNSVTSTITVNAGPTAGYSATTNGFVATFSNTSSNAASYSWNFGDNTTSTDPNPTHTYPADGVYTVILTATNPCGTSTFTQTVTIATPPTASFTSSATSGCAPFTVQFNNTSSANANSYDWQIPGGTPSSSTMASPMVVFNTAGVYTVTLTVGNTAGSSTATQVITVAAATSAGFSSTTNGATATFANSSSNASTYSWDFGDNSTGTGENPSHTYTNDGTYTVVLTATGPCGTSTASQTVTIVTPPIASFTYTTTTGCAPLTVQFTSTSSANTTGYDWIFPGGTPSSSTVANPVVVYNVPGTYAVTLIATNAAGGSSSVLNNLVDVTGGPNTNFGVTVSGFTATFSNTSSNASTYSWDFGDGNGSPLSNPSHTYLADGTYTVVLTATNACGTSTHTQNVVIINSPNAGFTANTTAGCGPLTVQFTDLSSGNTSSWNWSFPGGTPSTSTLQNPQVVYDVAGTFDVTLVATSAGGNSTFTQNNFINVFPTPTAGFVTTVNGFNVVFGNTSQNGVSYTWDFGDNSVSNQSDPTHTYAANGTYTVVLTTTNNCGAATSTQTIVISQAPVAAFSAGPTTTGCIPLTVQYTDQSTNMPTAWLWTFPGGTPASSTVQNPVVTYNTPGTFSATLQASNAGGNNTTTTNNLVITQGLPTAGFNYTLSNGVITFNNTSVDGTAYTWNFGDGSPVSNLANPTYTYTVSGMYTVELTVLNACGATTIQQQVNVVIVDVQTPTWLSLFNVYPNPNTGQFTVEMSGVPGKEVEFTLFNTIGEQIYRSVDDFSSGELKHQFYLNLPAAMYTLRIQLGEQVTFVKVAVQK